MSIAERRHHIERLKAKRRYYWGRKLEDGAQIGMVVTTPKRPQCACCGNPRRWSGERTIQERRARSVMDDWPGV